MPFTTSSPTSTRMIFRAELRGHQLRTSSRVVPRSFDELLHATFALWDVLDGMMREYEPNHLYATGYVRAPPDNRRSLEKTDISSICMVFLFGAWVFW